MAKALLLDLSRVLLFPKDELYKGELNFLHRQMSGTANYNPADYFEFESRTMAMLESIKDRVPLYIYTSGSIQSVREFSDRLSPIFKKVFSAEAAGWSKKDVNSYRMIARELGIDPGEVVFVDDSAENVEAAGKAGFQAYVYTDFEGLRRLVEEKF